MKKLLAIGGVIVIIFVAIIALNGMGNKEKLANNPYGTDKLDQMTIDLLDNKNYQNIILPEDLQKRLASGEELNVYFFRPDCPYCMEMTPRLMPLADELDEEINQFNLMEFNQEAAPYQIVSTPTLIRYKDGKEVARMEGAYPDEQVRQFFEEVNATE